MKKALAVLLVLSLLAATLLAGIALAAGNDTAANWSEDVNTSWYTGHEQESEFTITTAQELAGLAQLVNAGTTFSKKTVKLDADIDLDNKEWTPIGNSSHHFSGTFDGNSKKITGLKINQPNKSDVGLFGYTTDGEIKNFTLEDADVTGYLDVGAVAGTPYTSKYTNITLTGTVKVTGFAYVGGMLGKNLYALASNLTIEAASGSFVTADSENYRCYVGGVVGFVAEGGERLKNVTSNIDVYGTTCDVGGIAGIAHYGNIFENCTCSGDVYMTNADADGTYKYEVGGICGVWHNESGTTVTLKNCSFTGTVHCTMADGTDVDVDPDAISGSAYSTPSSSGNNGSLMVGKQGTDKVVAENGNKHYTDLKTAIDEAEDGDTVTLLDNVAEGSNVTVDKNITVKSGGYTTEGLEPDETKGLVKDDDGNVFVGPVVIDGTHYADLAKAFEAVKKDGAVVEIIDDVTISSAISVNNSVTIRGAEGITLTRASGYTGTFFAVSGANVKLTLSGVSIDAGGKWTLDEEKYGAAVATSKTGAEVNDTTGIIITKDAVETTDHLITLADGASLDVTGGSKITNFYTKDKHIVQITSGTGSVTLTDCVISHGASANQFIVNDANSADMNTITIGGGCVIEDNFVFGNGGLFLVGNATTLEIKDDAQIINNTTFGNGTVAMVYDYSNNGKTNKLVMSGGTISGNVGICTWANHFGSPIYIHKGGEFEMSGGSIIGNTGCYVGAIMENEQATSVKITGGTVKDNYYVHSVPEAMANKGYPSAGMGEIFIGAPATFGETAQIDGDLYVGMGGQLENGGTINADTYVYASQSNDTKQKAHFNNNGTVNGTLTAQNGATVNNSGTVDDLVINNDEEKNAGYKSTDGKITNTADGTIDGTVTLAPGTSMKLDEDATLSAPEDAKVDASFKVDGDTVTLLEGTLQADNCEDVKFQDAAGGSLTVGKDNIVMVPAVQVISGGTTTPYDSLQSALAAAQDGDTVELLKDIELNSTLTLNKNLTITSESGHSYVVTRSEDFTAGYLLDLTKGDVTLKNIVFDGGSENGVVAGRALVRVNGTEGTRKLILDTGAILRNNYNPTEFSGGAMAVVDGEIEMRDGSRITGSTGSIGGGIALVDKGASLTMSGGEISGNEVINVIGTDATAHQARGGGIYMVNGSSATLTGGRISNNKSELQGGGAYVGYAASGGPSTKLTINGGEISGNTAYDGGGIYIYGPYASTNPTVELISGNITNNKASGGAGVFLNSYCTLAVSGGRITGNAATLHGGAVLDAPIGAVIDLSGTPYITGNTGNEDTGADNIYMDGNPADETQKCGEIKLAKLESGARVDIFYYCQENGLTVLTGKEDYTITDDDLSKIHYADSTYNMEIQSVEGVGSNVILTTPFILDGSTVDVNLGEFSDDLGWDEDDNAPSVGFFRENLEDVREEVMADPAYSADAARDALENVEDDAPVYTHIETKLEITVEDYNSEDGAKSLTLEITPYYRVVASASEGAPDEADPVLSQGVDGANGEGWIEFETRKGVSITIPLPTDFANEKDVLYIKHTKDSESESKTYWYASDPVEKSKEGNLSVTFIDKHGFSTFTISATDPSSEAEAKIGKDYYTSLQEALDHVKDGDTIEVLTSEAVSGNAPAAEMSFKIVAGDGVGEINVTVNSNGNYRVTKDGDTYTVTYVAPPASGSSSYSVKTEEVENATVEASASSAKAGDEITVTVTTEANYHASLTVTAANGADVEVTDNKDGTFTFVMPASNVTVAATAYECPSMAFSDIDLTQWYHEYTDYAIAHGLMVGTDVGIFEPDTTVTRAQMAYILWNLEGNPVVDYEYTFTDVPANEWYTEGIRWAASVEVIHGIDEKTFKPNDKITREQMAAMLYFYEQKIGSGGFADGETAELTFDDAAEISPWAREAVAWCNMKGVITGSENKFNPAALSERFALATILALYDQLAK